MKLTFITSFSFVVFLMGCATQNHASVEGIEIVSAEFNHWSEALSTRSDVRERGTDLALTVSDWPVDAEPEYIIFRKRKSFPAEIADSSGSRVRIEARIILRSTILSETSQRVEQSDRLVFTNDQGEIRFIEIDEWEVMK